MPDGMPPFWTSSPRPGHADRVTPSIRLTQPRPGDLGWIVERHGAVYAEEYGWDGRFDGLVAEVVASFLRKNDPARERVFIARRGDERLGCVMVVAASPTVAKLRLMLVEPHARGLGLGKYRRAGFRLVASEPWDGFGPPTKAETWERRL